MKKMKKKLIILSFLCSIIFSFSKTEEANAEWSNGGMRYDPEQGTSWFECLGTGITICFYPDPVITEAP